MSRRECEAVHPRPEASPHYRQYHAGWWCALCPDVDCPFDGYVENRVYVGSLSSCARCLDGKMRSSHLVGIEDGAPLHVRRRECLTCGDCQQTYLRPQDGEAYLEAERLYPAPVEECA